MRKLHIWSLIFFLVMSVSACQATDGSDLASPNLPKVSIGKISAQKQVGEQSPANVPGKTLQVSLISPLPSVIFSLGDTILLKANLDIPETQKGQLLQVEFLADSHQLAVISTPPYEFQWKDTRNLKAGVYEIEALVKDEQGKLLTASTKVSVTIGNLITSPSSLPPLAESPPTATTVNPVTTSPTSPPPVSIDQNGNPVSPPAAPTASPPLKPGSSISEFPETNIAFTAPTSTLDPALLSGVSGARAPGDPMIITGCDPAIFPGGACDPTLSLIGSGVFPGGVCDPTTLPPDVSLSCNDPALNPASLPPANP